MGNELETSRRKFLEAGMKTAAGAGMASLLGAFGCGGRNAGYTPKIQMSSRRPPSLAPAHVPDLAYISGQYSLKRHAEVRHFLYGCGVDTDRLRMETGYAELVTSQCDLVTPENDMKMNVLRPQVNTYNFDLTDWLVDFCGKNHIKLRGHVLVWHEALPTWFPQIVNRQNARQILVEHIQVTVGRYAGRMHSWDVVNEVIDIEGSGRVDALRDSPWLRLAGDDYVELAFRTARDADPTALLCYNEYGIELETPEHEEKRAMVLLLLRRLKARQAPIDAMGIQSHLGPVTRGSYGDGLRRFMATVRDMDMQVFITELDVDDKTMPAGVQLRDQMVASTYNAYLSVVLPEPAVTAVLTWGITDRYSWLNNMQQPNRGDRLLSRPLLFDEEYRVKPAFEAVRNAFDARVITAARRNSGPMVTPADPFSPFTDRPYLPSAPPGQPVPRY